MMGVGSQPIGPPPVVDVVMELVVAPPVGEPMGSFVAGSLEHATLVRTERETRKEE
jgi:hypothetical protein